MSQRVQVEKTTTSKQEDKPLDVKVDTKEELKADLDELLDAVDAVLEENAEEFVAAYVQKGGE